MPNIVLQEMTPDGVNIVATDGRNISLSAFQIREHFLVNGHDATRAWVIEQIVSTLGPEQVPPETIYFDFDEATGAPLYLGIGADPTEDFG